MVVELSIPAPERAKPNANSSRASHAYEYIQKELLQGRWRPSDILSTYALAEELSISRTPISEALKRLEADGLVEIIPQVGCRVSTRPDLRLIEELCTLCGVLAGVAAESATTVMSAEQFSELSSVVVQTEQCAAAGDAAGLIDLNHRFYMQITEASSMRRLRQISGGMWSLLRHQLVGCCPSEETLANSLVESARLQRAIIEALRRDAGSEARKRCEYHIREFGRQFAQNSVVDESESLKAPRSRTDRRGRHESKVLEA